jgi:hypothetical protein
MRKLDKLPKVINEETPVSDVEAYLDLAKYIDDQIND